MVKGLRHAGIVVSDLEGALSFWCDILGFSVARQMLESGPFIDALLGLDNVQVTTSKLIGPDGNMVELLKFHSHPGEPGWTGTPSTTGLTHLAFTVEDLDTLTQRLAAKGFASLAPPLISADGAAKVAYVKGPEGLLLEFVEVLDR